MRVLLVLVLALACERAPERDRFTLRIARAGDLPAITPDVSAAKVASIAQNWVFEPLVRVDAAGALASSLADSFQRLDRLRYRMHLRPGAAFSDGSQVTLAEVTASLAIHHLAVIPDSASFIVESQDPSIPTDVLLIRALVFARRGDRAIGTGPFAVRSQSETSATLERLHAEPRRVERVILDSYPTPRDAFAHTLRGDADLLADVQPRDVEFFENVPRLQIVRGAAIHFAAATMNPKLSLADRRGIGAALNGPISGHLAYGDECKPLREGLPRALPPGPTLRVLAIPAEERTALAVRRALGARGGPVQLVEATELLRRMQGRDFDVAIARPLSWPPSSWVLLWRTGSPDNLFRYSNPIVDGALDKGDWAAARAALEDDPPAVFLCSLSRIAVIDARIKDPQLGPYDILESLPQWETSE